MIKQIWTIRSNAKLFNGLNFAISLFSLFYTILILFVLPEQIEFNTNQPYSKYWLLAIPLCATLVCSILYYVVCTLKKKLVDTKKMDRTTAKPIYVLHDSVIGINFLFMTTLFFIQIDFINKAKHIQGFSPLVIYTCIIALILFILYSIRKYIKSK